MEVNVYSAFTYKGEGGNLAGVVLLETPIKCEMKQAIAKKVGYSETVFIEASHIADFKMSFFTPEAEVDLCGHATVAAFSHLFHQGKIDVGVYTQETRAGVLKVEVDANGLVKMTQAEPVFFGTLPLEAIANSLNLNPSYLEAPMLAEVVSTGVKDLIVQVPSRQILNDILPNLEEIKRLSKAYDITGYHVFCLDDTDETTIAYARNFAPYYGIDEESATGTSNGALSALLFKHGIMVPALEKGCYVKQGENMGALSEIWIKCQRTETVSVQVGGMAKALSSKEID